MDIEEDRPVFLRVFNPALHLIGFGIAFEVDDIAAVFLRGQNLLDCGEQPSGSDRPVSLSGTESTHSGTAEIFCP